MAAKPKAPDRCCWVVRPKWPLWTWSRGKCEINGAPYSFRVWTDGERVTGFRLSKLEGDHAVWDIDATESYWTCECWPYLNDDGRPCKHIRALRKLLEALRRPATYGRTTDVANMELDLTMHGAEVKAAERVDGFFEIEFSEGAVRVRAVVDFSRLARVRDRLAELTYEQDDRIEASGHGGP